MFGYVEVLNILLSKLVCNRRKENKELDQRNSRLNFYVPDSQSFSRKN